MDQRWTIARSICHAALLREEHCVAHVSVSSRLRLRAATAAAAREPRVGHRPRKELWRSSSQEGEAAAHVEPRVPECTYLQHRPAPTSPRQTACTCMHACTRMRMQYCAPPQALLLVGRACSVRACMQRACMSVPLPPVQPPYRILVRLGIRDPQARRQDGHPAHGGHLQDQAPPLITHQQSGAPKMHSRACA